MRDYLRSLPDPDLRPQHRRHGGGHLRDGCLCRPRVQLLPGRPRHVDEGGRQVDRRLDRRRRPGGDRAGHVPGRPPAEVHPARLPAARLRRRGRVGAPGTVRHPRAEDHHLAEPPLRRDGPAVDGARALQHRDRQRRAGQQAGVGIRDLHPADPPVRRHQLAADPGLHLRLVRQAERGRVADRPVLRLDRGRPGRRRQNLTVAMLSVVPVLALGAIFFLIGSKYLPRDEDQAVAARREAGGRGRAIRISTNAAPRPARSPARSGRPR